MLPVFNPEEMQLTPFLFFTGKGGVGKTSTASALAVTLAQGGKRVLIVSTDPASNLQDVFQVDLSNDVTSIPNIAGLYACNLDPEEAAKVYREKVIGPYRGKLPEVVLQSMEEQLSGACTVEIAAFDEFTNLLANPEIHAEFDHIIFDTAPTGHTLRLLQLPSAWTDFLNESTHGASCLGPLSGLNEKKELYRKTVEVLSDGNQTTLMLVARPDKASLEEAARASVELGYLGIKNQQLLINGVLQTFVSSDPISTAFYKKQQAALSKIPETLTAIRAYEIPLVPFSITGVDALGNLFRHHNTESNNQIIEEIDLPPVSHLIDDLADRNTRVIFTMGKGGVGKTTAASLIAVGLVEKGIKVHLTTTDPAAHLHHLFGEDGENELLTISRIDPKKEVESYRQEVLSKLSSDLDEQAIEYIKEDLQSPCTEEIAVFQAFAAVVDRSKNEVVVIDTAPTGHTLLLLDAAHSYHKELERSTGEIPESVKELLPRLRNKEETEVVIVTLPEATPVFEAKRLQEDLQRASIFPTWWIINQSMYASETVDPVLRGRAAAELNWIEEVKNKYSEQYAVIPWVKDDKVGYEQLRALSRTGGRL